MASSASSQTTWEPTRPVSIVVPAGTGGGADQMARVIQGIVTKHGLMKQPMVVVNKAGGAGAEGFMDVKNSRSNPHTLLISLSNIFTTPLATGIPFSWKDVTPVSMMALDEFVLWVHADSPYKTAGELMAAVKAAPATARLKMGGTGSKQEDQIITAAMTQAAGGDWTYVPFRGGGEVAVQLVGKHIDATVNNPIEAVSHWKSGALRPLCVFDSKRLPYEEKIAGGQAWGDIPTCKEAGLDIEYLMMRGIFMPPGVTPAQVKFYVDLLEKVRATPEWKELMTSGAFNTTSLTGDAYRDWVAKEEERHRKLMKEAGFLAATN
ncbi:MAG TPA: tripartite tricarboxylate transporter substrate-binding protein [Beijerinckiaceae bacterium]